MGESPDIRIGTAEREQAMQNLSDHFAAGRLSVAEFDERSRIIAESLTRGDLAGVFTDLPGPVAAAPEAPARQSRGGRPELRGPIMGLIVILAVVLFLTTHFWPVFLLIPAVGAFVGARYATHDHDRRRERREQRRQWQQERRQLRRDRHRERGLDR